MKKRKNKKWHIYYLPNAYREYENQLGEVIIVHGKVGMSRQNPTQRKSANKRGDGTEKPLDVTGHEVIAWASTKEEAMLFERQYQSCYDCVELRSWVHKGRSKSTEHNKNVSIALTGRKLSAEHVENIREAQLNKPKSECPYCGRMITNGINFNRHTSKCKIKHESN